MATGTTITGSLADSLPTMIQSARLFEEFEMIVPKTVDRQDLPTGQGNIWNEIRVEQIEAVCRELGIPTAWLPGDDQPDPELAAQVLHIRADLPIILCTGFSESLSPEAAAEIGFGIAE